MCWIVYVPMTDIGQNLMRAVREEGDKTRALNREMFRECMEVLEEEGRRTRAMIKGISEQIKGISEQIKGISEQIKGISEQIKERNARIDKRLDQMTVTVESTSDEIKATSDDNREFFKQMLEAQNRILERDANHPLTTLPVPSGAALVHSHQSAARQADLYGPADRPPSQQG